MVLEHPLSGRQRIRAVIATTVGSAVEWYDFFSIRQRCRADLPQALLPFERPAGRDADRLLHLLCRHLRQAHRRDDLRPFRVTGWAARPRS